MQDRQETMKWLIVSTPVRDGAGLRGPVWTEEVPELGPQWWQHAQPAILDYSPGRFLSFLHQCLSAVKRLSLVPASQDLVMTNLHDPYTMIDTIKPCIKNLTNYHLHIRFVSPVPPCPSVGQDLTMEQQYEPYTTLFSNISLGIGSRPYGYSVLKYSAAAFTTFWNIRARSGTPL